MEHQGPQKGFARLHCGLCVRASSLIIFTFSGLTGTDRWRNRDRFIKGRAEIEAFLTEKWAKELDYRLKKELFCFTDNKIAVDFQYEYRNKEGQWFRAYGIEHWTFDSNGLMKERQMSCNDISIKEHERKLK